MPTLTYRDRRGKIETYFDSTAAEAWRKLTSTEDVSGVRATVRAGRDRMRATLLSWLPDDLSGKRVLDAGCGTGAFAIEAARRGADVLAIDLSPTLVDVARQRSAELIDADTLAQIDFRSGDMLDEALGRFDHVVAMDSLIHYRAPDAVCVLSALAARTRHSIVFTFAPRTPALTAMHAAGKLFPRSDRAPAIEPVAPRKLLALCDREPGLKSWQAGRTQRIASGFYTSQAFELRRTTHPDTGERR
ncbi:MAG: magnesium protoporphyrin IX methyltransferase [Pseudomonadota bacterium]